MPKSKSEDHEITSIALAYWRCKCGEIWRNEQLRNDYGQWKSDEDLSLDAREAFGRHSENL